MGKKEYVIIFKNVGEDGNEKFFRGIDVWFKRIGNIVRDGGIKMEVSK